jgi:hypothetical protein
MADSTFTGYEKPLEQYKQWELARLAEKYAVGGKTTGFRKVKKSVLIKWLKDDPDFRDADPNLKPEDKKKNRRAEQRKRKNNRLYDLSKNYDELGGPREIMDAIISALNSSSIYPPTPGKYYTMIYYAKTENIAFDRHPLIMVESVAGNHFYGYNFHWPEMRHYISSGVSDGLYEINRREYDILRKIPYKEILFNGS